MADKPTASLRFWQAWTLAGVVATAVSGARLVHSAHALARAPAPSISAKVVTAPRIEVEMGAAAPVGDVWLARLRAAETGREKCELVQDLPTADDPAATYAITEVLERTRFRSVRACATAALSAQPTAPAQSWLIDLATDPDPDVHRSALEALAAHGDSSALAVVIEAAHSADVDIRASAVIALLQAQHGEAFSAAVELLNTVEQRKILSALVDALGKSADPRALPVLTALVLHADPDTHLRAISALGELGQAKAEALLGSLLTVGSDEELQAAAKALRQLSAEHALTALRAALRSPNGKRRASALSALASSDLPGVTTMITEALRGRDVSLARAALRHLANEPDASLEPEVIALLGRDDRYIQRFAIRALARLGTPSALDALRKLDETSPLVGFARAELDHVPGTEAEARARRIRDLERGSVGTLRALAADPASAAQDAVLRYFSGSAPDSAHLQSVVASAPPSTVERLIARASTADAAQQQALIDGLAARGDPSFVAVLRAAARDENDGVRRSAVRGLVQLGDGDSAELLAGLVKATDPSERAFAAELLGMRPDADTAALLEALAGDHDVEVVTTALSQLRAVAPERAVALATRAYQSASPEDRTTLLSALGDLPGGLAIPLYERALQDSDESVVLNGVRSFGQLQRPGSAQRLLAVATDANRSQEVRVAAAQALRALGGPLVRDHRGLLDALDPPDVTEGYVCSAR